MLQPTKKPLLNAMYHHYYGNDVIVEGIASSVHNDKLFVVYRNSKNELGLRELENGHSGWNDPVHTSEGMKERYTLVELL